MKWTRILLAFAAGFALLLIGGAVVDARPGGGQSYSGGGGHGGGSGGGDGAGALIELLFYLIIYYPQVGIPLAIIVAIVAWRVKKQNEGLTNWDSGPPVNHSPGKSLEPIRSIDEDFSSVLFGDFVYKLYAQVHTSRGQPNGLAALAPYLGPNALQELSSRAPVGVPVTGVVVGAMRVTHLQVPSSPTSPDGHINYVNVGLEFETNMSQGAPGSERSVFLVERWQMARAADVKSKPPGAATSFPCPNCGAPFESTDNQKCDYCDEVVNNGRFDWLVTGTGVGFVREGPPLLTGYQQERGTDLPTYTHGAVNRRWGELRAEDPALNDENLAARVHLIYGELNEAYSNNDLTPARGLVSDGMFDYLNYWITAYKQQGLRNELKKMRLTNWAFAKIIRDKYFDAITLRLWATGFDYTVNERGKVVAGTKISPRDYSEYWTLIRSSKARGAARSEKQCPKCGAPLKISMAGACEHCSAHITSGEFDWVLSKIEQDDSYRG